jgi:hypothetical protein
MGGGAVPVLDLQISPYVPTFKKTLARALESLALEDQPPASYMPSMSAPTLMVAAPVFLLCTIQ